MYGALLGDIIGSPYEFDMGDKKKEFPLFSERSAITDDTVMTLAVAEAVSRSTPSTPSCSSAARMAAAPAFRG